MIKQSIYPKGWCVYFITNLVNTKLYIGYTGNPNHRWNGQHLYMLRHNKHTCPHLQAAWNKYGESNFEFKVFRYCKTKQEVIDSEIELIAFFKKLGLAYNHKDGGDFVNHDEETRRKISEIKKLRYQDPNFKPNKGRVHTKEAKENMNNSHTKYVAFGEEKTVGQWAKDYRCLISYTALTNRIWRGWKLEKALTIKRGYGAGDQRY
jgi:group I intron endonuclease